MNALNALSGKTVVVAAPSRQMLLPTGEIDEEKRQKCVARLEAEGARVRLSSNASLEHERFAGTDGERAAGFMEAMTSGADLALMLRGGYGATRLLPLIDWKRLEESPVPACGYSDFTVLQAALFRRCGRFSWHGPTLSSFAAPAAETLEAFRAVFQNPWPGVLWRPRWISGGAVEAEGLLWGGNLSMITSLVGTPWLDRRALSGGILFIEEVAEPAYRIERMLLTLLEAGILGSQRALLLGDITGADRPVAWAHDFALASALGYVAGRLRHPLILGGFPMGHAGRQAAVPLWRRVRILADAELASLGFAD